MAGRVVGHEAGIEAGDGPSSSPRREPRPSPTDPADPHKEVIVATKKAVARSSSDDGTRVGDALVVELLTHAYWMELETVANYLAASVNLEGIRGAGVGEALAADVAEELDHARRLAQRLKELGATVPGSLSFTPEQRSLQPFDDETDVVRVIEGVLDAEEAAIGHYRDLIEQTDGLDWVTQALAVELLGGEEAHRRRFQGYLREYRR